MASRKLRGENDFSGGINNEQSPSFLNDNETVDHVGFDFDNYPTFRTRKGKVNYGASGGSVTRLLTNYRENYLFRAVGTKLQYDNSGTWTDISGTFTNADWDAVNFEVSGNHALILTNGTDDVKVYTGGSTVSNLSANAPKGKYITADPSRVYIAKDDILYWSGFQDATDWTSAENSGFAQYYTYNGGDITALFNFKDIKYIFKKNAMAGLYGTNYFDYRIIEVSNNIGCVSFKTVQEVNGRMIWLGEQDVYMFTQGNPIPIGNKIMGFIKRINWAQVEKCCAFTDGLRYYLNLVLDNATEPNLRLVYDTQYDLWRVPAYDEKFRYGTFFNNKLYAGDANGQTMIVNEGDTDNGTPISWSLTSKAFNEGVGEAEKEYKEIHYQGEFFNTQSMNVYISTSDQGEDFIQLDYDPLAHGTSSDNKNVIVPMDTTPLAYWMRYRLSGTGQTAFYLVQRYYRICRVQH